jgi:hypothetical protein
MISSAKNKLNLIILQGVDKFILRSVCKVKDKVVIVTPLRNMVEWSGVECS